MKATTTDLKPGSTVTLATTCPSRPGESCTIVCNYKSVFGAGWVVRFEDGKEMAILPRHLA